MNGYLRFAFASRPNYIRVDVDDEMSLARLARFCGREGHKFSAVNVNHKKLRLYCTALYCISARVT